MSFVAGVGNINIDLTFSGLPRIPGEGEELFAQAFNLQLGGGPPGTLINLRRLGVPTCIQTQLGTDMFSDFARGVFKENGVSPVNLYCGTDIPLNITTVMLTPGDRTFISYSESGPVTDQMQQTVYQSSHGAKIVEMHLGYLEAYRKLKAEGTILVFDTGWADDLSIKKYRPYLELADYYTPNQKEAMKITGTDSPTKAAQVLCDYFDHVIVKLDKDGCLIIDEGRPSVIPNIPDYVHQDSTGAGDAFLSGLLYGLYNGYNFKESVLFGNITGGKCVTAVGCLTAFCTETELLDMAQKYRSLLES